MSNYDWFRPRQRRRHLFIVEGKHEKNELMKLLLKSFPEIDMDLNDVIVYGTNIYQLYLDIIREYADDWDEVDLPFIVSKKRGMKHRFIKPILLILCWYLIMNAMIPISLKKRY